MLMLFCLRSRNRKSIAIRVVNLENSCASSFWIHCPARCEGGIRIKISLWAPFSDREIDFAPDKKANHIASGTTTSPIYQCFEW
jgi:hypothetical protein